MNTLNRRSFVKSFLAFCSSAAIDTYLPTKILLPREAYGSSLDIEQELRRNISQVKGYAPKFVIPEGCESNLRPILKKLKKNFSLDVELQTVGVDDVSYFLINQTLAGEQDFDIALPATFTVPDLVEAGVLKDLTRLSDSYESNFNNHDLMYTLGDFYKGKRYGYQTDGDCYVMFYNKKYLEDSYYSSSYSDTFGQKLSVPNTWKELDRIVKFIHRPDKDVYGGSLFRTKDYIAWEWWLRFHAKGQLPFSDEFTPLIAGDLGVAALEELVSISPYLDPKTSTNNLFKNWKSFGEGKSFCNIGWGGTQKFLRSTHAPIGHDLVFGETPGGVINGEKIDVSYFNWGWNYVVGSRSRNPLLSYLIALYCSSSKNSLLAIREANGFFDPYRKSHYEDQIIRDIYSNEFLAVHKKSMRSAIPDLYMQGQGRYWSVLSKVINYCNQKKLKPREGLKAVEKEWQAITKEIGRDSQIAQWKFLRSKYPKKFLAVANG